MWECIEMKFFMGGSYDMENFSLDPKIQLASIAIKVKDIDKMVGFYQRVVGLDLINEENDMAIMGIGSKKSKLLGLIYLPEGEEGSNNRTGLNHIAYVFPERFQLASFVHHLLQMNYPIDGTSDHGYCEAIYITDPEGNRLSFSWDRPKDQWPLLDGKIDGVTKELDLYRMMGAGYGEYTGVPEDTKLGSIHLSVDDLDESYDFYTKTLGFELKDDDFINAHYLTLNEYHHQIALSAWSPTMGDHYIEDEDLGVDHITFKVPSFESLLQLKEHLEDKNLAVYFNKGKKIIGLTDPNGIQMWFMVFEKSPC